MEVIDEFGVVNGIDSAVGDGSWWGRLVGIFMLVKIE